MENYLSFSVHMQKVIFLAAYQNPSLRLYAYILLSNLKHHDSTVVVQLLTSYFDCQAIVDFMGVKNKYYWQSENDFHI